GIDILGGTPSFKIYLNGNLITMTPDRWYGINDLAPGTYTVRVVDANWCETTKTVVITGASNLTITTTSAIVSCSQNNGAITVSINGGTAPFNISLDGNLIATTNDRNYTITGLTIGNYTVSVTDANGCSASKVHHVYGQPGIHVNTSSTVCGCGQSNGTISLDITGGAGPFQVFVNGNLLASTPNRNYVIGGLNPGSYTVRVVDTNGCEDTSVQNVGGGAVVDITTSSTACGCGQSNGTITVDIAGGSAPFNIFVNGNLLASTSNRNYVIAGLSPGTYTVRVVDAHGCED